MQILYANDDIIVVEVTNKLGSATCVINRKLLSRNKGKPDLYVGNAYGDGVSTNIFTSIKPAEESQLIKFVLEFEKQL